MKKKVRPVLVETKENTEITLGINITRNIPGAMRGQNYELILISLEDESIGVGDLHLNNGKIEIEDSRFDATCANEAICKKVIARQSQISPEYISKFIKQYNNGCVEDLEIEMKHYWVNSDGIKGDFFTEVAKFESSINQYDAILINHPKLTNNFITIVEKESISYTEEEVLDLLGKYQKYLGYPNILEDRVDWFKQNKKR